MSKTETKHEALASELLGSEFIDLDKRQQRVIEAIAAEEPIAENINSKFRHQSTLAQRLADTLARVVGSWGFIISFLLFLGGWMVLNTVILVSGSGSFDPYPYILLNLVLSTIASIQAPIIMMSQNRQSEKDRISAANAFEVSLKTELLIQQLHEKIDRLEKK